MHQKDQTKKIQMLSKVISKLSSTLLREMEITFSQTLTETYGRSMEALPPAITGSVTTTAAMMHLRQEEKLVRHHSIRVSDRD